MRCSHSSGLPEPSQAVGQTRERGFAYKRIEVGQDSDAGQAGRLESQHAQHSKPYKIVLRGELSRRFVLVFEGMSSESREGQTLLGYHRLAAAARDPGTGQKI